MSAVRPIEPAPTVVQAPQIPRSRTSWPWIVVALAVGVTGGIAAVTMTSDEPSEIPAAPVESAPPPAVVVSEPPPPVEARAEAEAKAPEPADTPEKDDVVLEVEPDPPKRARPSRKKKRRRRAATKDKPAGKPGLDADYLPPSRRSG